MSKKGASTGVFPCSRKVPFKAGCTYMSAVLFVLARVSALSLLHSHCKGALALMMPMFVCVRVLHSPFSGAASVFDSSSTSGSGAAGVTALLGPVETQRYIIEGVKTVRTRAVETGHHVRLWTQHAA